MVIGQRIKITRKNKGFTQKELAELAGTATGTIQQYELGKRQPRADQLRAIASALGVTVDYLLGTYTKEPGKRVPTDNANDRYPYLLNKKLEGSITLEESKELATLDRLNKIAGHFETLTEEGQQKAVERVEELTEIPKYQKKDEPDQK